MRVRFTGFVWETSSSDSHSGQLKISPSSTSSSSTSISAEHSGQRITDPSSVELVGRCVARTAGTHVERIIYRVYEVNCCGRDCCDKANVRALVRRGTFGARISGTAGGGRWRGGDRGGPGTV